MESSLNESIGSNKSTKWHDTERSRRAAEREVELFLFQRTMIDSKNQKLTVPKNSPLIVVIWIFKKEKNDLLIHNINYLALLFQIPSRISMSVKRGNQW